MPTEINQRGLSVELLCSAINHSSLQHLQLLYCSVLSEQDLPLTSVLVQVFSVKQVLRKSPLLHKCVYTTWAILYLLKHCPCAADSFRNYLRVQTCSCHKSSLIPQKVTANPLSTAVPLLNLPAKK